MKRLDKYWANQEELQYYRTTINTRKWKP